MFSTKKKIILVVFAIIVIVFIGAGIYVNDYYHASEEAIEAFVPVNSASVEIKKHDNNTVVYLPEKPTSGFIFYPGGKVEYTAYEPLMKELASEGVLCVLIEMPFN
jgi:hypothetical protein